MDKREKSREEWEREMWERQRNVTYDESLRAVQHIAKSSSSETFSTKQLIAGILGTVLAVIGLTIFRSQIPHAAAFGSVAIVSGAFLIFVAFQGSSCRDGVQR